jgi:hypothetical protein
MRCKGRIFESDLKENDLNTLNDFSGAEFLFDEYYQLDASTSSKQTKSSKKRNKFVIALTEFDHLKDDLKKTFLAKVLSSIGVNLPDVLVHYQNESSPPHVLAERYETSTLFVWTDDLPSEEAYFSKKTVDGNALYYFPSLSNVMSDKAKKVTLWTLLKKDFVHS